MKSSLKLRRVLGAMAASVVGVAGLWWWCAGSPPNPELGSVSAGPTLPVAPAAQSAAADEAVAKAPQAWRAVTLTDAAALSLRVARVAAREVIAVQPDATLLQGKLSPAMRPGTGRWTFLLPEGTHVVGQVDRTKSAGPDAWVSEGRIEGIPGSRWVMAAVRGRISVSISGLPGGEVKVRTIGTAEGPVAQLYRVDPALAGDCVALPTSARPKIAARNGEAEWQQGTEAVINPSWLTSGDAVIDVLVAYTMAVRDELGGADSVWAEALLGLSDANWDFYTSDILLTLRLAGIVEVDLPDDDEDGGKADWQLDALESLAGVTDGVMDNVHAARDATGADLVTLMVRRPDPRSSGIAYILEQLGDPSEPYFAFSVVDSGVFSNATTLSHELGHNLGCAHDRENAGALPDRGYHGAFPAAYGYRTEGVDTKGDKQTVRSIMAYRPGTRLRYFSNPSLRLSSYTGPSGEIALASPVTLGVALADDPVNAADNASVIRRTAFQVASHRVSPTRGFGGRLVNVSTRAYVGNGYRTLTGGFVVTGRDSKRVLVRAPGPVLGSDFGVPGALADSVLRVNRLGVGVVGENDNWDVLAANATAVNAAGATAGAFALPAGGRDAALVLDLEPGAYSAEVTGARGSEGIALVEAYDVGAGTGGGARVINLSTRAYASTATPMVAGFVVRADAGAEAERKTMFVRVRGPSLVNYGLPAAEVMPDPMIEIYDEGGHLIFVNDDWDSPSLVLDDSIPEVHRGVVDQPSEEAVFAAAAQVGATDMLPVEPGAVIELPAGLYTMFVRPFSDEADPEGEPGVAIVEVFELDR